jgi:hypothetical protein
MFWPARLMPSKVVAPVEPVPVMPYPTSVPTRLISLVPV